jgi:hypothetical protein
MERKNGIIQGVHKNDKHLMELKDLACDPFKELS